MRHRYGFLASATAAVAAAALLGCGSGGALDSGNPIAGSGNPLPSAGTTGTAGGTAGTSMMAAGKGGTTGSAGSTPPGGTAGMSAGSGGQVAAAGSGGASGGSAGGAGGASGAPAAGSGSTGMCQPAMSVDMDGPYKPTHITNGGASGSSWVFFPEELGKDGMKHPVFNWGPGAGTGPSQYTDHLNRLASHGFVVISQPSSGSGTTEKASLDWLLAENEKSGSMFYQKLDPDKVGAGGHSLGSLTTMAMAGDERLKLYVLVCGGCMSGRGGCGAADIHGPTVILGGDTDIGTPNYEGDYSEIKSPVVFLTKDGTDHIACARNNLAPWVAFMRWHFCGEEAKYKADFLMGGAYCKSPWECKSKGF